MKAKAYTEEINVLNQRKADLEATLEGLSVLKIKERKAIKEQIASCSLEGIKKSKEQLALFVEVQKQKNKLEYLIPYLYGCDGNIRKVQGENGYAYMPQATEIENHEESSNIEADFDYEKELDRMDQRIIEIKNGVEKALEELDKNDEQNREMDAKDKIEVCENIKEEETEEVIGIVFCNKCGFKLLPKSKFCSKCGAPITIK